jgi:Rps23 Pro-64 3,4-dihydroxylase Tpa1-like proline 4-hydroxylase
MKLPIPNRDAYINAAPFPHAVFQLNEPLIYLCAKSFPDLNQIADRKFDNQHEKKLVTNGESKLSKDAKDLIHYLNSEPFLLWLSELTGIQHLMPDPYLIGGGYHEIKRGGKLGIHVDFDKHGFWGADRVLNVLIYLNEDWQDEWGGHLKLYDESLNEVVRVSPSLGTMAIFSTSNKSWHGHPEPLQCPQDRSRKSIALYYYAAPDNQWSANDTIFRSK